MAKWNHGHVLVESTPKARVPHPLDEPGASFPRGQATALLAATPFAAELPKIVLGARLIWSLPAARYASASSCGRKQVGFWTIVQVDTFGLTGLFHHSRGKSSDIHALVKMKGIWLVLKSTQLVCFWLSLSLDIRHRNWVAPPTEPSLFSGPVSAVDLQPPPVPFLAPVHPNISQVGRTGRHTFRA